jgi:hypothetical protein
MSKENIYLNLASNELTIREGEALPLKEPEKIKISGIITAVSTWLKARIKTIDQLLCHVLIDRDQMTISLVVNERDFYSHLVTGELKLSKEFNKFEINTGKKWTTFELADFIKMHRSFLESENIAAKLISELKNFTAKIEKEKEAFKDDRANFKMKLSQVVTTNIPNDFKLTLPVFKGMSEETIIVEINIDADTFQCYLCSPMANDLIETTRNSIIDEEIKQIQETTPEIVIIEV